MNTTWITIMTILGITLFINCIIICKLIIKDYKKFLRLTAPVYPIATITNVTEIYPVTIGTPVNTINEDLEIIHV